METINEIIKVLMILIRIGVGLRLVVNFIKMMLTEDVGTLKQRSKNVLFFYATTESIYQLTNLIIKYYGGDITI